MQTVVVFVAYGQILYVEDIFLHLLPRLALNPPAWNFIVIGSSFLLIVQSA